MNNNKREKLLMSNNNILKESFNLNKRNQKQKNQKELKTALIKRLAYKNSTNIIAKFRKNKDNKKYDEERRTHRQNNKVHYFEKAQNNCYKIFKREKSADHFKKKPNLRQKIQNFFNEFGYYDTNYIHHNINNINKKLKTNNKKLNNKNYNTLILFKKNKGESIDKKRKSYFSPEKLDPNKKNNFYKRLLNLRTVSGSKYNTKINNNDILLFNHKENINNNYENNYNSLFKSLNNGFNIKNNKSNNKKRNNKNKNNNIRDKKSKNRKINKNTNILYKSHNLMKKIGFTPQKINSPTIKYDKYKVKEKEKEYNILAKSTNFNPASISNNNNNDLNEKSDSHEKIFVNKNEENNIINNSGKINVRKIDIMSNYNINNSINMENKNKNEEICLTEETQIPKINENYNDNEQINNIKVCKIMELKKGENKKAKDFKRNKSCKKPFGFRESMRDRDSNSTKKISHKSKNKNKTPNKESLFNLKNFQNLLLSTIKTNFINNNNINININNNSNINNPNSEICYLYNILYGNNGKLVEKVLKTRKNWEKIDSQNPQCANLIWTPLSCQINYSMHTNIENSQFVNHFEFHRELTNKASTFINLFRYCEFNDIDLFSFYPLTIILSSNIDYLQTQIEGFKRCYEEIPNLLYNINTNELNNNNNIYNNATEDNNNIINDNNKFYINYFFVNLSKKIGTRQKIQIPKTFYIGKNLWLLKRTNLNRGREMKVLSNLEDIIKEINTIFDNSDNKKQKPRNLIIQKYLESPLLYKGRKFDIRIWVLFTYTNKDNNYSLYVFKEGHLKACSDEFNIDNDNLFIHLTNYSVQKYNKNFSKSEVGNEISFKMFQEELDKKNSKVNFKKDIFPEIIKIIWITGKALKNKINIMERKNCFEIYGYDFILDTNYTPFLLEINTNPGLEESSPLIQMLVPRMIDDTFRLTIDKAFGYDKNKSMFSVEGYTDEENMWQKIKKI